MDRAFLESFRLMDPLTQQKMEELLGSWRTGGPDGSMVYPERLLKAIEEGLYGFHGRGGGIAGQGKPLAEASHYTAGLQQRPSQATQEEVSQLLSQIRSAKGVSMAKAHRDPTDHQSRQSLVLLDKVSVSLIAALGISRMSRAESCCCVVVRNTKACPLKPHRLAT